jgi:uncharacterized protein
MRAITWVIKSSKLCNLRCRYCYEMENLASEERIEAHLFPVLFSRIREISCNFDARPKICWHGGEPLLLPKEYYLEAFRCAARVFQGSQIPKNVVQTNLTLLDDTRLSLLKLFDHVSVSLDVAGGLRTNLAGRDSQAEVLKNLAIIEKHGIKFGAIAVLNQHNLNELDKVFTFFNQARIHFRVLPYYRQHNSAQAAEHSISACDLTKAYRRLVDLWFTEGSGIIIKPIDEFIQAAISYTLSQRGVPVPNNRYKKDDREVVYVIDTSGAVYSVADTYDPKYCHGNLFTDSSEAIVNSPGRRRAIDEAKRRQEMTCQTCAFWGNCSGFPMGEATPIQRYSEYGRIECAVVKNVIEYVCTWLAEVPSLVDLLQPHAV